MTTLGRLFVTVVFLDRSPVEALRLYGFLVVSVGAHVVAALALFLLPLMGWLDPPPQPVSIELIEPTPEPEPPEPEPEPEPEPVAEPEPVVPPEPAVQPRVRLPADPPPSPEPPAPEPPPAEETVADFSGMTLTNDQGASWASATGSGAPMDGPIGRPGARVTGRNRSGTEGGTPGGTGSGEGSDLVAPSDLSRRPGPPSARLVELLRQNYPRRAQTQGLEGSARVRVRVESDGRVRALAVVSEDHEGFGEACRATIRAGGNWEAPLDRSGNAVATITTFRCTFTLDF